MAKKTKILRFGFEGFDLAHYKATEQYVRAVDSLFNKAIQDVSIISQGLSVNDDKAFKFKDYPKAQKQLNKVINGLSVNMTTVITKASKKQWLYASEKSDKFIASIFDTTKLSKSKLKKMQDRNLDAFQTFQKRKVDGMDLSQRVWKYVDQFKDQMELGLDVGIGEGKSAQQLSRDLRQYLNNPDKLFRRVRDKRGNLHLSKNAKAFHPGVGVYRSSAKNAARLTRSEINMSYRESDWLRWQQLDFVIGFEIKRSNHEPLCKCKLCERLTGKYPKEFKFRGWHPQCMCVAIPILMDDEDFNNKELADLKSALRGEPYRKVAAKGVIREMPDNFRGWVTENTDIQQGWKSVPYFIRDNFVNGTLSEGLSFNLNTKPVKTAEQIEDIKKRWNQRVGKNKYNDLLAEYTSAYNETPSISSAIKQAKEYINQGKSISDVDSVVSKIKHKVSIKEAWDDRVENNALSVLLDDVANNKAKFGLAAMQTTYKAVEDKLSSWENESTEFQIKKLKFEIEWVEKNKKYDTWSVAQGAYKKRLSFIEYKIEKQTIENATAHAFEFFKTTKSAKVKALANELQALLNKDASIDLLKSKSEALNQEVTKLEMAKMARDAKKNGISPDAYTQKRKDAALWAKQADKADTVLREMCGNVWQKSSDDERMAAYRYTAGSSYINEPLRGQTYSGQYLGKYDSQKDIDSLTKMVNRSFYAKDVWLQRGVGMNGAIGLLGENLNTANTTKLIGKTCTEKAFSSCAAVKGKGFSTSDVIYNIYCPKGTKMMYCEPFSAFGAGGGKNWDGISGQKTFNYEVEVLLQRGTTFRITKIEQANGKWYIDMDVISQL